MSYQSQSVGDEDSRLRDTKTFVQNLDELAANSWPGRPIPGTERIEGMDRSGNVYCIVDPLGNVLDVQIESGWWNALGPAHVGAAILDALEQARSKAAMAVMILTRYGHKPDVPEEPDFATQVAGPRIPLPDPDDPDLLDALNAKIERAFTVLDAADRIRQAVDNQERRVVAGPQGLFRLVLVGLAVQGAEVDHQNLGPYDGNRLAADARAALRAVGRNGANVYQSYGRA
ncbi:hypothetical protein ACFP2T_40360 [Plantactinospora solaniradicis]|uniref:ESX secretion-associated protein EspG n=1 Tax=Plantactinospora solaniradicis TaxID=1723736 RepID=A0ABW1KKQ0_9ACTN